MSRDTEQKRSIDYQTIFDTVPSPYALVTPDFVFAAVNEAYCNATGRTRGELIGNVLFDVFPDNPAVVDGDSARSLSASIERVIETRVVQVMPLQRYDVEEGAVGFVERYWSVTNTPILDAAGNIDYVLVHPEEVTSCIRHRLAREADGSPPPGARQSRAVDTVFTTIARLHHLNELTAALVGADTVEEVARALLRDGLGLAGASCGSVVADRHDRFVMVDHAGIDAALVDHWGTFPIVAGADPFSDAVQSGEPLFFEDRDEFVAAYPDLADEIDAEHHAWAVLPFRHGDATIGALGLIYPEPTEFTPTLRLVLYTIASLGSQAASRARLVTEQAEALESVERALLELVIADVDDFDARGLYRPSTQITTVGGDWYDVVELDDVHVLIVIGDVANHGTVAVGEMARARATLQTTAVDTHDPALTVTRASASIDKFSDTYATATVAVYDRERRTLTWTSAGHLPALLVPADPDRPVERLDAPHGPPLGVPRDYTSSRCTIGSGDTLVLYTDGLIERRGELIDVGLDRLVQLVEHSRHAATPELLFDELHPTGRNTDDVAVLTVTFGSGHGR